MKTNPLSERGKRIAEFEKMLNAAALSLIIAAVLLAGISMQHNLLHTIEALLMLIAVRWYQMYVTKEADNFIRSR